MAPVQPSLLLTAPAARSQLLTSARNSSKARGHASVYAATAAIVPSLDTVQQHLLSADTETQNFTFHQPSVAKDNIRSLLS